MLLECEGLSYSYPGAAGELFRGLSLRLAGPGFHALFGPSGVGKTTLARVVSGEIAPQAGRIRCGGGGRVLYTYNLERLPGWASLADHLAAVSPAGREALAAELLDACGIRELARERFHRLSLGQQNRANLVRYLLQEFDLLVMDESLANVDEATRGRIILRVKALFPERGFLYISHNVAEVARFCREILVLRGPGRAPQAAALVGCDETEGGGPAAPERLERAMLEIVHAA